MRRTARCLYALAASIFIAGCGTGPAKPAAVSLAPDATKPAPVPIVAVTPTPPIRPAPPIRHSGIADRSGDRFKHHAFAHAEHVLVIKVAGWQGKQLLADVVEEIRGLKTPKRMPIAGLDWSRSKLTVGSRWIVATYRSGGSLASGGALAILADNAANRRKVRGWALPPWRYTPIVMVVRIATAPVPGVYTTGGRVELDVVRVLRGKVRHRRITDNAWRFAKFRPFKRSRQLYVLSAWTVTPSAYSKYPFFHAHAMTPVSTKQLRRIADQVRAQPLAAVRKRLAASRARLAKLQTSWTFQRSPLVANTEVGSAAEETTGCGGRHFTLVPKTWRRGTAATRLATAFSVIGRTTGPAAPYLFYGGGHCYHGRERAGNRFISAGWVPGRHAAASVPDTPQMRAQVRAWLSADRPRFAPLTVDPLVFNAKHTPKPRGDGRDNLLFEPRLDIPALSVVGRQQWLRLKVVATRTTKLATGSVYRWIHVRTIVDQRMSPHNYVHRRSQPVHEFMFAGVDLPAWKVGERYWGYWLDARTKRYRARTPGVAPVAFHADKLFVADSFVRDDGFYLNQLLRRARHFMQFKP